MNNGQWAMPFLPSLNWDGWAEYCSLFIGKRSVVSYQQSATRLIAPVCLYVVAHREARKQAEQPGKLKADG
ncbi:MAG: hypothetical protein DRP97_03705 [Candidatus Latescibacterota bacterium]|nr:MAG: hypothetical protein DRP97_03705 [Candidatus Latescibacterota bacterium]